MAAQETLVCFLSKLPKTDLALCHSDHAASREQLTPPAREQLAPPVTLLQLTPPPIRLEDMPRTHKDIPGTQRELS